MTWKVMVEWFQLDGDRPGPKRGRDEIVVDEEPGFDKLNELVLTMVEGREALGSESPTPSRLGARVTVLRLTPARYLGIVDQVFDVNFWLNEPNPGT